MTEDRLKILLEVSTSGALSDLTKVETGLKNIDTNADTAADGLKRVADVDFNRLSSTIDQISGKLTGIGTSLTLLSAPFEIFAGASVAAFSDFETGMNEVFTLIPDATQEAQDQISAQVREFATTNGVDIKNVVQGVYDALSAGVPPDNVFTFLATSHQAAKAGVSDVSTAVDTLTSIVNAYKDKGLTAEEASDALFTTIRLGKTNFSELSSSIANVTSVSAPLGVDFNEIAAAIATITSQGKGTNETMTTLKALLSELSKDTTGLGKVFKDVAGQDFYTFIQNGGTLSEAIDIIAAESQRTGKPLTAMAGSIEAAQGAMMLSGGAAETFKSNLEAVQESAGATEKAFDTMSDGLKTSLDKVSAAFTDIQLDVGGKLAPVIDEAADWLIGNADTIKEFAGNVTQAAIPAIKGLLDILKSAMDAFNGMSPETRELLAKVFGIGIAGAAIGGPMLLGAGLALGPISSLAGILSNIGTAASTSTGLVSGLQGVLAGLGGGPVMIGIGAVALAIGAWETDFMNVRTNGLKAMDDLLRGSQEKVGQAVQAGADAVLGIAETVVNGLNSLPVDFSFLTNNIETSMDAIRPLAESKGSEAAYAWIDAWNQAIKSGTLNAPDIPGAETASQTFKGTETKLPDGMTFNVTSGTLEVNGLTYQGKNASTVGPEIVNAQKNEQAVQKFLNSLPSNKENQAATTEGAQTGTEAGAKAGIESAIPSITDWLAGMGKQGEDESKFQAMYDKFLQEEYGIQKDNSQKTEQNTSAIQANTAALVASGKEQTTTPTVTTPTTSTGSTAATAAPAVTEKSLNIPSLFERDPARYFEQQLKPIIEGGFDGSIDAYTDYLSEYKMTLEDKARMIFRSDNTGGSWNEEDWVRKATQGIIKVDDIFQKLGISGMDAAGDFTVLNLALSDTRASISETKDYLSDYNRTNKEQIKYTDDQEKQTRDLMNSLGLMSRAQDMYNNYMSDGVLDATESAHIQGALSEAMKLMGDAGINANSNLSGLPGALQALASAAQQAMSQINAAVAMANAQISNVRKVGDWTLQTMTGLPTIAPSTPTNFKFASGGPVTQNGPAYLHQGEYVLRRDEVRNGQAASAPVVHNHINMQGSKFGQADMSKDIPKIVARATRRALSRYGV